MEIESFFYSVDHETAASTSDFSLPRDVAEVQRERRFTFPGDECGTPRMTGEFAFNWVGFRSLFAVDMQYREEVVLFQMLSARLRCFFLLATRGGSWNGAQSLVSAWSRQYASKCFAPIPPNISSLESPSDMSAARQWAESFRKITIPREAVELTFSRSSGPGGQNVNKVNTKCSARCSLRASFIPSWAKQALRRNPAYVSSTDSLLVTSTQHRSQAQNVDDCLQKLHSLIVSAALSNVRNETSEEQKKRVEALKKLDKARRRQEKEYQSKKKQMRKGKIDWD